MVSKKTQPELITAVIILALTLFAWCLRLYRIDAQSLWYDEGYSIYIARMSLEEAASHFPFEMQPPLYYLLLHAWIRLGGVTSFAVRCLSAICATVVVPAMYVLGRRTVNAGAGLLGALFTALSPLYFWYAQETRMYALVLSLTVISAYLLVRVLEGGLAPSHRRRLWVAFGLVTLGAMYTHYFSLFLLPSMAMYFLWCWWRGGREPGLFREGVAVATGVALVYLPWVPMLLRQAALDTGYWTGRVGVVATAARIITEWSTGITVEPALAKRLTFGYLVLLVGGVLGLVWGLRHGNGFRRRGLLFLVLYLVIPLGLMLFVFIQRPKISVRYTLVASPPYFLLLAGGIGAGWRSHPAWRGLVTLIPRALCLLAVGFIAMTSVYSLRNAIFDENFARPDFRRVTRYLGKHIGPDESIILVSGHFFPIFDYYYPNAERLLIPNTPVLKLDVPVDFSVAQEINRFIVGRKGIWLVLWQNEIVDPSGVVIALLEDVGWEVPVGRTFHGVGLRHFLLPPGALIRTEVIIDRPSTAILGNGMIRLLGARLERSIFAPGETVELRLFWQALAPVDKNYTVFTHLLTPNEHMLAQHDSQPVGGQRPTKTWKVGEVVEDRHWIHIPAGTESGQYTIEVGMYRPMEPGMPRLEMYEGNERVPYDRALLGIITVRAVHGQPERRP